MYNPTKSNPFFVKESFGSRSWRVLCSPLVFFLPYSPNSFCSFFGIWERRTCPCIWCIGLSSPLVFFLPYSSNSFCSFVGIWERRTCPLHLVHRFEFSLEIRRVQAYGLVTLGFLEP